MNKEDVFSLLALKLVYSLVAPCPYLNIEAVHFLAYTSNTLNEAKVHIVIIS